MKKVISFSLWGNNPKYTIGAIRNAELSPHIYPGWICRFYYGDSVPNEIISQLLNFKHCELIYKKEEPNDWTAMFWRFESCCDFMVSVSIFRDTDSRLCYRERSAVDEWLCSGKTFHIMRDHPYHNFPILGGMWGFKQNLNYDICSMTQSFSKQNKYGIDYDFFNEKLYPLIGDDKIVHDEFFDKKPFPKPRDSNEFVGDVFDEHNNRHSEYNKYILG